MLETGDCTLAPRQGFVGQLVLQELCFSEINPQQLAVALLKHLQRVLQCWEEMRHNETY